MHLLCMISEFSHISEKADNTMCREKWRKWIESSTDTLESTIIASIDDDRFIFSSEYPWPSCLRDKYISIFFYLIFIDLKKRRDDIERKDIFYLIESERGKCDRIVFREECYFCIDTFKILLSRDDICIRRWVFPVEGGIFLRDISLERFMSNRVNLCRVYKQEFRISIPLESSELF